jgi:hypothetical protein
MDKVVLISDVHTELGLNLLRQFHATGYQVIGTSTTDPKNLSMSEFNTELVEIIHWNRVSPIGVKNLLIKAITRFRQIDEVIILQTASFTGSKLSEISLLDIDQNIDMWLKGTCYLLKEMLAYLSKNGNGSLTLVNNISYTHESVVSPVGEILEAGFRALVKNLFKTAKDSPLILNGVESTSNAFDKLGDFIYKIVTEKTNKGIGKLYNFHDKKSFFSSLIN